MSVGILVVRLLYRFYVCVHLSKWFSFSRLSQSLQDTWAWTGTLTFKSKKPLKLQHIELCWKGPFVKNLAASLYEKGEFESTLIPIKDNLICDGSWNPQNQKLSFHLNEKIIAVNKYHLVLSLSSSATNILQKGHFEIKDVRTTSLK